MRMAGPDVVLFVVGALLFGGATYAIISSGGLSSTSAAGVFDVTFAARDVDIGEPVAAGGMRAATADFDVNLTNVGAIKVTVSCADPAGTAAPFNLQVQVSGPNNLAGEGAGVCGTDVVVEIGNISTPPERISVPGSTEDQARANLPTLDGGSNAVGAWTVSVSGARNAGPLGSLPGVPVVPDPSGTIALTASVWEPTFTPVQR